MSTSLRHFALIPLIATGFLLPTSSWAQDDEAKPADTKAVDTKPTAKDDAAEKTKKETPEEEWDRLTKRRQEITDRLLELRNEFGTTADNDKRRVIQGEFVLLLREFESKVEPRMTELAEDRFKKDDKDVAAGEFLLNKLIQSNQFAKAVKVSDKLMELDAVSPFVKNMAGLANFATNNFGKAQKVLTEAKEAGDLDDRMGGRYLGLTEEYTKFWAKEQEIRKAEAAAEDAKKNPLVLIKTSRGDIEIELFENEAPNTVANFIELTEKKAYDGLSFHRVIANFMIQGGDPNSKNDDPTDDGQGGPGYSIKCECYGDNARMHFAGTLSMAHAGRDTGGSQFFITHLPTAHLNGVHTAFGRVIKGMDVVASIEKNDKMKSVTVVRKRDHEYKAEKTADSDTP